MLSIRLILLSSSQWAPHDDLLTGVTVAVLPVAKPAQFLSL